MPKRVTDGTANCNAGIVRELERSDMLRSATGIVCLCALACGLLAGCAGSGLGLNKKHAFGKDEQWEPDVEAAPKTADWKSAPSNLRKGKAKESSEDPIDKLIWSDTARDINRNLGGSL